MWVAARLSRARGPLAVGPLYRAGLGSLLASISTCTCPDGHPFHPETGDKLLTDQRAVSSYFSERAPILRFMPPHPQTSSANVEGGAGTVLDLAHDQRGCIAVTVHDSKSE